MCVTLPILQRRQLRLRESEGMFTRVSSGWGQSGEEAEIPSSARHPGWPTSANQMSSCPQRTRGNGNRRVKRKGRGRQSLLDADTQRRKASINQMETRAGGEQERAARDGQFPAALS